MGKTVIMVEDAGKYDLKAIGRDAKGDVEDIQRVKFRAKMYDMDKGFAEAEGNSYKIELDGKTSIVGEQGEDGSNETSKTSLLHKLCAYAAITEYLEPNTKDNHIKMVLACPITILKNAEAKEEYKNYIKGNGIIKVKVNDKDYEFEIDDVTIKAEDSGIVYLNPEWFEGKKVALLGFGGLNMNFTLFENSVAVPSSRFSIEYGSNRLIINLADTLSVALKGENVLFSDAEKALNEGVLTSAKKPRPETISVIEKFKIDFVKEVKEELKKRGYNLDLMDEIVAVGGTVSKIESALKDVIRKEINIPAEPQWASVEGLYKIAYLKYLKK
ncbi:ParM/StbA family protein [Clostridium tagluense]|uniref:ParM/StbA family protein n=1 Tax=Clostridium tagluense TaxID=360422 RepID=UPI001CF18471|nr:ParM/StbA family protein [Clostridium tagluense]MCB2300426.1 ParM/StbA family protein [Clostridium tagluense]